MNRKSKILLVDDDMSIRKTMAGILKKEGYEVEAFDNGYDAINAVKENSFDVALLDIKMPGINGVETFKEIKGISPETIVIMMTACAVDNLISEAVKEGAYAVLNKPLDMGSVLDTVGKVNDKDVILVVDDDFGIRDSLSMNLEEAGFRVISAGSGKEAVKLAARRPVDIILMDIKMPEMDGVETLKKIRENVSEEKQPITIMMSGYDKKDKIQKAFSYGAKKFLKKPVDINLLKKEIEALVSERKVVSGKEESTILIVDDDASIRDMLSLVLEDAGYKIRTASSGREAIREVREDHHKAILLDVMLPDINGLKLYEQIKEIKPEVGIIVITAYKENELLRRTIQEGGLTYLFKPFDTAKLLKMIDEILQRKPDGEI